MSDITKNQLTYEELVASLLSENAIDVATFEKIINCVSKGNNKLQQKEIYETFVFEEEWIYYLEGVIFSIEKIAKSPKSSIIDENVEVPIEKARKTTAAAVRHLSSHTNRIRGFDEDGVVMPTHLLSTEMREDKAIYENRFVYTLIKKLLKFVDDRYDSAKNDITTYTTNILKQSSEFKLKTADISYNLSIEVKTKNAEGIAVEKTEMLLEKIKLTKQRLEILLNTDFCRELSKAKLVTTPIIKTNILTMNVDYKNCYKLFLYISAYTSLGYSVQVADKNLSFDVDFFDDLTIVTALSLKAMTENNLIRQKVFQNIPYSDKKSKYRVINKIEFNPKFTREKSKDDTIINQYYFDKIKDAVTKAAKPTKSVVENTKTISQTFTRFFKTLSSINKGLYEDVLKINTPLPDRKKPISKKLANLNRQKEVYKNSQLLTRLMTRELNQQIKKEAGEKVRAEKLNFEYEKMLLEHNKKNKKVVKKKKIKNASTYIDKYVDKKIDVIVGRRKIINKTLLDVEYEKQRKRLEKQEATRAKHREAYRIKKEMQALNASEEKVHQLESENQNDNK